MYLRCLVRVVAHAPAHFGNREEPVAEVYAEESLVLPVRREDAHGYAHDVAAHGKAFEQFSLVGLCGSGGSRLFRLVLNAAHALLRRHRVGGRLVALRLCRQAEANEQ